MKMVRPPKMSERRARATIRKIIDYAFGEAIGMTGCHAPFAIDAERVALAKESKLVASALLSLPKDQIVALGAMLEVIDDECENRIAAAEAVWEARYGNGE